MVKLEYYGIGSGKLHAIIHPNPKEVVKCLVNKTKHLQYVKLSASAVSQMIDMLNEIYLQVRQNHLSIVTLKVYLPNMTKESVGNANLEMCVQIPHIKIDILHNEIEKEYLVKFFQSMKTVNHLTVKIQVEECPYLSDLIEVIFENDDIHTVEFVAYGTSLFKKEHIKLLFNIAVKKNNCLDNVYLNAPLSTECSEEFIQQWNLWSLFEEGKHMGLMIPPGFSEFMIDRLKYSSKNLYRVVLTIENDMQLMTLLKKMIIDQTYVNQLVILGNAQFIHIENTVEMMKKLPTLENVKFPSCSEVESKILLFCENNAEREHEKLRVWHLTDDLKKNSYDMTVATRKFITDNRSWVDAHLKKSNDLNTKIKQHANKLLKTIKQGNEEWKRIVESTETHARSGFDNIDERFEICMKALMGEYDAKRKEILQTISSSKEIRVQRSYKRLKETS